MEFTQEELARRTFLRVAQVMYGMWEEKGSSDTRLLMEPLVPDAMALVGRSVRGGSYREHVVPRMVICDEVHSRFSRGWTADRVAPLIQRTLRVVLISDEERRRLDGRDQLDLKTRMPPGWDFETSDVMVRLESAAIRWERV